MTEDAYKANRKAKAQTRERVVFLCDKDMLADFDARAAEAGFAYRSDALTTLIDWVCSGQVRLSTLDRWTEEELLAGIEAMGETKN